MPAAKKRMGSRVNVGVDNEGNPIYKWAHGYTKSQLKEDKERLIREHIRSEMEAKMVIVPAPEPVKAPEVDIVAAIPTSPLFRDYAMEWYKLYKRPTVKEKSRETYEGIFKNHLFPEFGDTPIASIQPNDLQRFIVEYDEYSKSTINKIVSTIKQVIRHALDEDILIKDPTRRMNPPPGVVGERKPLTMEEVTALTQAAIDHPDGLLPLFLLYTGTRRGEALAVRWENVKAGYVHIKDSVSFFENQPSIKETKTKAGRRSIPLNKMILDKMGAPGEGFLFGQEGPYSRQKYRKAWERLQRDIPVLEGVTAHVLRHTYTMLLRRAGVDPATAQYLLGHENYSTTANIYTHIGQDDLGEMIRKMEVFLPRLVPELRNIQ